jgi:hypothetical protein
MVMANYHGCKGITFSKNRSPSHPRIKICHYLCPWALNKNR